MTTNTSPSHSSRPSLPWRARAQYPAGKTRRQRQEQYRQQTTVLWLVVLVTVVAAGVVVILNWQNAGSTKAISCKDYPTYCVPLAGGSTLSGEAATLETADTRTLNESSRGVPGVVRYIDSGNVATIGKPDAPIHFRIVTDFSCSHCNDYHDSDLTRFIRDYVLAGQATVGIVQYTGIGGQYSQLAAQAALCSGEQGGYWEMSDELFRIARSLGVVNGFTLPQIKQSAKDMGLDADKLVTCISSGRYINLLAVYANFATDNGVTATPTLLVSYGDSGEWSKADRNYDNMKALTEAANQNP